MALLFAPHSVTIYPRIETPNSRTKIVPVPTEGSADTDECYIYPEEAEVLFDEQFGDELKNPHKAMINLTSIAKYPYGARVVRDDTGEQLRVTRKANRRNAGGDFASLDYAEVEMELLEKQS
jgi:hypothetical protein